MPVHSPHLQVRIMGCCNKRPAGVTGTSVPPNFRSGGPNSLGNLVPPPPPPPPGPKSLDAQNQLNRTHFPRELSPPRTEISVRIYYTLVHVHQKLARFDSRVKWRVVGKVFVMKPCRGSKSTLQKAATPWGYYSEAF